MIFKTFWNLITLSEFNYIALSDEIIKFVIFVFTEFIIWAVSFVYLNLRCSYIKVVICQK